MLSEMQICQIRGKGSELNRIAPRSALSRSLAQTDPRLLHMKQMVINGVSAANSKRTYAQALDHLFAFTAGRPINRELLLRWRAAMEKQSPSTVNSQHPALGDAAADCRS